MASFFSPLAYLKFASPMRPLYWKNSKLQAIIVNTYLTKKEYLVTL
jgi:hypothetical protein